MKTAEIIANEQMVSHVEQQLSQVMRGGLLPPQMAFKLAQAGALVAEDTIPSDLSWSLIAEKLREILAYYEGNLSSTQSQVIRTLVSLRLDIIEYLGHNSAPRVVSAEVPLHIVNIFKLLGTDFEYYETWERLAPSSLLDCPYGTITRMNETWYGSIGTKNLPNDLEETAMSLEMWRASQNALAYAYIYAKYPDLISSNHKRENGRIVRDRGEE